jgi:hypothetical protein
MKINRILTALAFAACFGAAAVIGQSRVIPVQAGGTAIPLSTTTEIAHGATAPTWTAVVGGVPLRRASSTIPTGVTTNQPVAPWASLNGAGASFLTAYSVGGCTPGKLISAATTNATVINGSVSQLYTMMATNTNAAVRYLKVYDKATAPTVGTDVPKQTIALPPNGANPPQIGTAVGLSFAAGIGFALTTGVADTDTAAVAANEIVVNYCYKS